MKRYGSVIGVRAEVRELGQMLLNPPRVCDRQVRLGCGEHDRRRHQRDTTKNGRQSDRGVHLRLHVRSSRVIHSTMERKAYPCS